MRVLCSGDWEIGRWGDWFALPLRARYAMTGLFGVERDLVSGVGVVKLDERTLQFVEWFTSFDNDDVDDDLQFSFSRAGEDGALLVFCLLLLLTTMFDLQCFFLPK